MSKRSGVSARSFVAALFGLSLTLFAFFAPSASLGGPRVAEAFTVRTAFTQACHEVMTLSALFAAVDSIDLDRVPEPRTRKWEAVVDWITGDLGVSVDDPRERFYYFSLLAGVRAPDTDGHSFSNLETVRALHVDPAGQHEHCLRAPHEDGAEGNVAAAEGCVRAFVAAMEEAALAAGEQETRIFVPFMLDHYGRIELEAWAPAFHLGRALHVLQDSFSHTIRTPDLQAVVHVMNYAEAVSGTLIPSRDGLAHSDAVDRCDLENEERSGAAVEATTELLSITGSTPDRLSSAVMRTFVDRWLALDSSANYCTLANDFCASPWLERALEEPTTPVLGCSAGASVGTSSGSGAGPLFILIFALVGARLIPRKWQTKWQSEGRIISPSKYKTSGAAAKALLALFAALSSAGCVSSVSREPIEIYFTESEADESRAAELGRYLSRPHSGLDVRWQRALDSEESLQRTLRGWFEEAAADPAIAGRAPATSAPRLLITLGEAQGAALEEAGCLPEGWVGLHLGEPIGCDDVHIAIPPDHSAGFLAGVLAAEEVVPSIGAIVDDPASPLVEGLLAGLEYRGHSIKRIEESRGDEEATRALADALFDEGHTLLIVSGREAQHSAIASARERDLVRRDSRLILLDPKDELARRREVLAFVRVRFTRMLRVLIREAARGELEPGRTLYGASDGFVDVLYTRGDLDEDDDRDDEDDDDYERWPRAIERRLRELADESALAHLE